MKRRDFLKLGSASVAGGYVMSSPVGFLSESKSVVGITDSFLRNSGYRFEETKHLVKFEHYEDAIAALKSKKIDALITSSQFLSKDHPELMLFGSFPSGLVPEQKQQWINGEYSHVKSVYNQLGLNVNYVTMLSPLQIRLSKLSPAEIDENIAQSKKMVTVAQAARATWFEEMGFKVYQGNLFNCLFEQLLFMKRHDLQITDSFSPGLVLQNVLPESQITKPHELLDFAGTYILKDNFTKDSLPIELVTRAGESYGDLKYVTGELVKLAKSDSAFQNQVLNHLSEVLGSPVYEMPKLLAAKISMFRDLHLAALATTNEYNSHLVNRYRNFGAANG
ncbi:MAG: hypothetical protein K0R29_1247 [Pseudobdellovibrio sp.]|jgi:hypothetical protein|nr:hypothetical protein [Pseudobdellovibrio sp.]